MSSSDAICLHLCDDPPRRPAAHNLVFLTPYDSAEQRKKKIMKAMVRWQGRGWECA